MPWIIDSTGKTCRKCGGPISHVNDVSNGHIYFECENCRATYGELEYD